MYLRKRSKYIRGLAVWMAMMAGAASVAGCGQRENKERQEEKPAPQEIAGEEQSSLTGESGEGRETFAPEQEEAAAEEAEEPPQAARPSAAAPTPAAFRKLRREMRFIVYPPS